MKTIRVTLEEGEYQAARQLAHEKGTTVTKVLSGYLSSLAGLPRQNMGNQEVRAQREKEKLAALLSDCNLELGFKPSREHTYEGGRFSRF